MNAVPSRAGDEIRFRQNLEVQRHRRLDAFDHGHLERAAHARDRFLSIATVRDDLGEQRVVVRRHGALCVRKGVDAHAWTAGHAESVDDARRGRERLRIFGVDTALDGVPRETSPRSA